MDAVSRCFHVYAKDCFGNGKAGDLNSIYSTQSALTSHRSARHHCLPLLGHSRGGLLVSFRQKLQNESDRPHGKAVLTKELHHRWLWSHGKLFERSCPRRAGGDLSRGTLG